MNFLTRTRSTSSALPNVFAQLIHGSTDGRNPENEEFRGFRNLSRRLTEIEVINALRLNVVVTNSEDSRIALKQFEDFLKPTKLRNSLKQEKWLYLELTFAAEALASPWIKYLVQQIWRGIQFSGVSLTWDQISEAFDESFSLLSPDDLSRKPDILPPLTLSFSMETSPQTQTVFVALCKMTEEVKWPIASLIFMNSNKDEVWNIPEDCMEVLLDVCSSKNFEGLSADLNQMSLNKYFSAVDQEKTIIFTNFEPENLTKLPDEWVLARIEKTHEKEQSLARFEQASNRILVFMSQHDVAVLLRAKTCQAARMNLGEMLGLISVKLSENITVAAGEASNGLEFSPGQTFIRVEDNIMNTMETLENIMVQGKFTKLQNIHIKFKKLQMNEEVELRIAAFKEFQEHIRPNFSVEITIGEIDHESQKLVGREFSVNHILRKKIDEAVKSGKLLSYSRPKLVMLGPSKSGKTSTLRGLLNLELDEDIDSTKMAENKWDVKVEQQSNQEISWETSEVTKQNNGMDSDLADLKTGIDFQNSTFVFNANISVQSRRHFSKEVGGVPAMTPFSHQNVPKRYRTLKDLKNLKPPAHALGYSKLRIWDTSESDRIMTDHLLHDGGIYVLTLSLATYSENSMSFKAELEEWISFINSTVDNSYFVIVGNHADSLSSDQIKKVNKSIKKMLEKMPKKTNTAISNRNQALMFFPVDHSDHAKEQFDALRNGISDCLPWLTEEIPVSWLYFMDLIFQTDKTFMSIPEFEEQALKNCIDPKTIPDIIKKYSSMGALLSVQERQNNKVFSDLVVLKPQIFVEILQEVYEKTGDNGLLKSKDLKGILDSSLENEKSRYRFSKFCGDSLIFSRWIDQNGEMDSIFVPARNIINAPDSFGPPVATESWSIIIAWKDSAPRSFFEQFLVLLITTTANLGGGLPPVVFHDAAQFTTRDFEFFVVEQNEKIEIRFQNSDASKFVSLASSLERLCEEVEKRGLQQPFVVVNSTTELVKKRKTYKVQVTWANVYEACLKQDMDDDDDEDSDEDDDEDGDGVLTLPAFNGATAVYFPSVRQYQEVIKAHENSQEDGVEVAHICIVHDWGVFDETSANFSHHQKVLQVVACLRQNNVTVAVDESGFLGFEVNYAEQSIRNSSVTVLILTTNFLRHLKNPHSAAYFQLNCALQNGIQTIVGLAMETEVILSLTKERLEFGYTFSDIVLDEIIDVSKMSAEEIATTCKQEGDKMVEIMEFMANYGPADDPEVASKQFPWLEREKKTFHRKLPPLPDKASEQIL